MKISIVTVTYNCKDLAEETIENVLSQTYSDIEYVVIDGGSKDGTVNVIKEHSHRISFWISEPDKGIFDAMNKSLGYVTGKYVLFMNAGDKFVNNHVVADIFEGKDYDEDLVYGDVYIQNELGYLLRKADPIYLKQPKKRDFIFKSQGICHQSLFTKTSVLKQVKFDLNYPIGADYDTTAKVFLKGNHSLRYGGCPIAVFDDRTGGASHGKIIQMYKERMDMFGCRGLDVYVKMYFVYLKQSAKTVIGKIFSSYVMNKRKKKYTKKLS